MKKLFFLLTLSFGFMISSCSDPCKDITCSEVGTCDDGTCTCDAGYTGDNCETELRSKFIGDWQCNDYTCDGDLLGDITFSITADNDILNVLIFDKEDPDGKVVGTVTNGQIVITDGTVDGEDILVNGTISLEDNTLTMAFVITEGTDAANCTGTATKL